MHEGSRGWAIIATSADESASAVEGILTPGLLWLDWTRGHATLRAVEGLRVFIPEGGATVLQERLLARSPQSARIEIFEMHAPDAEMHKIPISDAGNVQSWLVARRDVESVIAKAQDALGRIRAMRPSTSEKSSCDRVAAREKLRFVVVAWNSSDGDTKACSSGSGTLANRSLTKPSASSKRYCTSSTPPECADAGR